MRVTSQSRAICCLAALVTVSASFDASADTGIERAVFESLRQQGQDVEIILDLHDGSIGKQLQIIRAEACGDKVVVSHRRFEDSELYDQGRFCDGTVVPGGCEAGVECLDCDEDGVDECQGPWCVREARVDLVDSCASPGRNKYWLVLPGDRIYDSEYLEVTDSGDACLDAWRAEHPAICEPDADAVYGDVDIDIDVDTDLDADSDADGDMDTDSDTDTGLEPEWPGDTGAANCGAAGDDSALHLGLTLLLLAIGLIALRASRRG